MKWALSAATAAGVVGFATLASATPYERVSFGDAQSLVTVVRHDTQGIPDLTLVHSTGITFSTRGTLGFIGSRPVALRWHDGRLTIDAFDAGTMAPPVMVVAQARATFARSSSSGYHPMGGVSDVLGPAFRPAGGGGHGSMGIVRGRAPSWSSSAPSYQGSGGSFASFGGSGGSAPRAAPPPQAYAGAPTGGGPTVISGPVHNEGTIDGPIVLTGTVNGDGNYTGAVAFTGTFSPGNSPAHVTGNDMIFDGTLVIELGGRSRTDPVEYDSIDLTGTAALGGTLDVHLISWPYGGDVFTPVAGDTFDILTAETFTGAFTSILFPELDGAHFDWQILFADGRYDFQLRVVSDGTSYSSSGAGVTLSTSPTLPISFAVIAAPEPAPLGVLAAGLVLLIFLRRRAA